jgi:hypothetical protein
LLKWLSVLWTAGAVAIIVLSNLMIVFQWAPFLGLPFDVQSDVRVALLLAPGAVAAIAEVVLQKWQRRTTA